MDVVVFLIWTYTLKQNIIIAYNTLCSTWGFFLQYFLYFFQFSFFNRLQVNIEKFV